MISKKQLMIYFLGSLFWVLIGQFTFDLGLDQRARLGLMVWLLVSNIALLYSIED